MGTQWIDIYQSLANATEREVAAFSNGYSSDHERAYAALQHWTIRDSDANLAKLINALHRQRRIDVVEKIRCVMEDNPQVGPAGFAPFDSGLFRSVYNGNIFDLHIFSTSISVNIPGTSSSTDCSLRLCLALKSNL